MFAVLDILGTSFVTIGFAMVLMGVFYSAFFLVLSIPFLVVGVIALVDADVHQKEWLGENCGQDDPWR